MFVGIDRFHRRRYSATVLPLSPSSSLPQRNGFQRLDKMKDSTRQSKQLEELTGKIRECKRLIKEFELYDQRTELVCSIEENIHEYPW
ncbi:hypothetical protein V6N13_016762 [Hibiscus sabdariffa]